MSIDIDNLPDDVDTLKQLIVRSLRENAILSEQLRLARARLFGRKSERFADSTQSRLFDEIEAEIERGPDLFSQPVAVAGHTRGPRGRKPLPEYLPRKEIIHDISPEEKICGCGSELKRIGEEVAEKLEIIPADVFVERHIRPKYACAHCKGADSEDQPVKIAPVPPQILDKSLAGPGLLAHLVVSKFCDALPFHRQEAILRRLDIDLGRNTMCNWMIQLHEQRLGPLLDLLRRELVGGPRIHGDETPVQVLREPDRKDTTKSYMFVLRGGPPERPVVLYLYRETRSAEFLRELLTGYRGVFISDGYAGYDSVLEYLPDIEHAGCWAHARRYFVDVMKVAPESRSAAYALHLIGLLYRIERRAKKWELNRERHFALRQRLSHKIAHYFLRPWLDELLPQTPPKSRLGEALNYLNGQWPKLVRFLGDPVIPLDNNLIENDIRPFVIGRKNWIFSGGPRGAHASAALYTLVLNAKANNIEPFSYLRLLFVKLPQTRNEEEIRELLPQFIDRGLVKSLK